MFQRSQEEPPERLLVGGISPTASVGQTLLAGMRGSLVPTATGPQIEGWRGGMSWSCQGCAGVGDEGVRSPGPPGPATCSGRHHAPPKVPCLIACIHLTERLGRVAA